MTGWLLSCMESDETLLSSKCCSNFNVKISGNTPSCGVGVTLKQDISLWWVCKPTLQISLPVSTVSRFRYDKHTTRMQPVTTARLQVKIIFSCKNKKNNDFYIKWWGSTRDFKERCIIHRDIWRIKCISFVSSLLFVFICSLKCLSQREWMKANRIHIDPPYTPSIRRLFPFACVNLLHEVSQCNEVTGTNVTSKVLMLLRISMRYEFPGVVHTYFKILTRFLYTECWPDMIFAHCVLHINCNQGYTTKIYLSTILLLDLNRFFSFLILYAIGKTPCTGDKPVTRSLPTHRTTQTQNKRTQTSIPLSGIRTHDPNVRASEDSSCLKPRGHGDRQVNLYI
jgi:hypothetical protein